MNKTLLLSTATVAVAALVSTAPAMAQTSTAATGNSNSSYATVTNTSSGSSAKELVNDATQTVQRIKSDTGFEKLLKKSKGVFIMPNVVSGAFLIGGTGAQGVLLKHNSDGSWSNPVFLTLASVSIGAQAGGKAGPAAMFLMTDKAVNDFMQANNLSLSANAGLNVVNYSAQGQAAAGKGDVVTWSQQSGLFAGANVSGATINLNSSENQAFYGKQVDAEQILNGKVSNPQASSLKDALPA